MTPSGMGMATARMGLATPSRMGMAQERGAVTLFVAIAVVGLMAMLGLVVDGGGKIRAVQRADRLAAEAARAAGQAVDARSVLSGEVIRVDRTAALAAAQQYLSAADAHGRAEISPDGRAITVTTEATVPTVFLGLVGVPQLTVTGTADARLVHVEGGVLR